MEGKPLKVVVVDDELDVVTFLAALLTDNGYEAWTATDGSAGLALVREQKPDLVCLDVLMPGETGFSLFRKIRKIPGLGEVKVMIISGVNCEEEVSRELARASERIAPPDRFFEKPVRPEGFLEAVKALIG